jgi:hypothetical protein
MDERAKCLQPLRFGKWLIHLIINRSISEPDETGRDLAAPSTAGFTPTDHLNHHLGWFLKWRSRSGKSGRDRCMARFWPRDGHGHCFHRVDELKVAGLTNWSSAEGDCHELNDQTRSFSVAG